MQVLLLVETATVFIGLYAVSVSFRPKAGNRYEALFFFGVGVRCGTLTTDQSIEHAHYRVDQA